MLVTQDTLELFQHTLQPHWGLATPVSVRGLHALYQFEDGKVREFRLESPLLRRVRVGQRHQEAVEQLHKHIDALKSVRRQRRTRRQVVRRAPRGLAVQVELFKKQYPLGFQGIRWNVQMRGHGSGRRLKRHRDPAILGARQRLSPQLLGQLVAKERHDEVHRLAMETLAATDLLHASQRRPLVQMSDSEKRRFALRLTGLLHDDAELFGTRFEQWVQACDVYMKRPPAWEAVTAPLALYFPNDHVSVRPERLAAQAKQLGMPLVLPNRPHAEAYREALGVVRGVQDLCAENGLAARDLLDVCDFMEVTLATDEVYSVEATE